MKDPWIIMSRVVMSDDDGDLSVGVPIFYIEGSCSKEGACALAKSIIDPFGMMSKVYINAEKDN